MFNVALLGGGLDPISLHHEMIADKVKSNTSMSTWVMPCYGHLFSKGSRLTAPEHRLNMVNVTAEYRKDDFFVPFDWEIQHKHAGSMYETVVQLKAKYPDVLFHIVIGMDNANVIETKWDRGNLLIQENPFIVFERDGVERTADWFLQAPHRIFPMSYNLSSTAIREAIQNGNYEFAKQHVNPAVWEYIGINELYGYKA
jgi:nicotinate-nucleotide adenylyltransferase